MNLSAILTQSQERYSRESDTLSTVGSLHNSEFSEATHDSSAETDTNRPVHPESEQTSTIYNSRQPCFSRPQSFPHQRTTIMDDRLRELTLKYEIQETLGERLRSLEDYEIIILCDDSGSMKTPVDGTTRTRWDELRDIVKIVLEIGTIFDSSGVDIFFLNRPPILNVTDPNAIDRPFSIPPRGYTPLVIALRHIFNLPPTRRGNDKKALVFIATDGAPTDDRGNINVNDLEHLMIDERKSETTHVMFLICTDDPACVDYLTEWDRRMVNVDVTDDFKTEREKIRKYRGPHYPFSKGDYIVKALVGAIDPEIDNLNEPDQVTQTNSH